MVYLGGWGVGGNLCYFSLMFIEGPPLDDVDDVGGSGRWKKEAQGGREGGGEGGREEEGEEQW